MNESGPAFLMSEVSRRNRVGGVSANGQTIVLTERQRTSGARCRNESSRHAGAWNTVTVPEECSSCIDENGVLWSPSGHIIRGRGGLVWGVSQVSASAFVAAGSCSDKGPVSPEASHAGDMTADDARDSRSWTGALTCGPGLLARRW